MKKYQYTIEECEWELVDYKQSDSNIPHKIFTCSGWRKCYNTRKYMSLQDAQNALRDLRKNNVRRTYVMNYESPVSGKQAVITRQEISRFRIVPYKEEQPVIESKETLFVKLLKKVKEWKLKLKLTK